MEPLYPASGQVAYSLLEKNILEKNLCTSCGACEATCPTSALQIVDGKVKRLYNCNDFIESCQVCHSVCPHSESLLLDSLQFVSEAPNKSEAFGYFRKIILAQSTDPKTREKSHGGGVVTSLVHYGIENKIFDSAIVSPGGKNDRNRPEASVALTANDVFSAIGSKFFQSSVVSAYRDAVVNHGKTRVAVVGLPCHMVALRKTQAWQHKLSKELKMIIGMFCSGTFSQNPMLEYLALKYKIQPSKIKQMYFAGKFVVETEDGVIQVPIPEIKAYSLNSCKTCMDFSSEVADISIGSAHPLKNTSIVVIRTKRAEEFFDRAVESGVISIRSIDQEPKLLEHVIKASTTKREKAHCPIQTRKSPERV